ncbi:MAG TPA: hypothetical protein VKR31_14340 [Rhizomicrobium sp.]|nr:hypothetical protein [Rhizomicrobium sp.]
MIPTPAEPLARARHFRDRAEELRIIASECIDIGTREMLGRVARDYERMAALWENQTAFDLETEDAWSATRSD